MVLRLNSNWLTIVIVVSQTLFSMAQDDMRPSDKDYKDKDQFERFYKRRVAIAAWQINELRDGALVVRLKTNEMLIQSLLKQNQTSLALEKQLETAAINVNTMRAYINNYTFSKLYFMFSNSSDSLLNGHRKNIFLDTNLRIDPSIVMNEKFYLLAERDYAMNSSIGFVKEDTARFVKETGYGVKEMALIVKNKFGHQLKKPFPYFSSDRADIKIQAGYVYNIPIFGTIIPVNVGIKGRLKEAKHFDYQGHHLALFIPKYLLYERISLSVSNFNEELKMFYRTKMSVGLEKQNPEIKPFLY